MGEVRGAEAFSMLQAFSTGHSGSLSSIHANSAGDALSRLETMVLMGMDLPLRAIRGQIASSIDLVIHLGRLKNGERRLLEIIELLGLEGENYSIHPLFSYAGGRLMAAEDLIKNDNLTAYGEKENYEKGMKRYRQTCSWGQREKTE